MPINRSGPQGPQGPPPADPRKAAAANQGQRATPAQNGSQRASSVPAPAPDQVQISAEAVELSAREEIPRNELPFPRLVQVSRGIANGHYSLREALDATARGVLADLANPDSK